jgi:hypothetical protein
MRFEMLAGFELIPIITINEAANATWPLIANCFPTIRAKLNLAARARKFKPHRCGIGFALLFRPAISARERCACAVV